MEVSMLRNLAAGTLLLLAAGTMGARAEETTVIHRDVTPDAGVTVVHPGDVTIERHDGPDVTVERRSSTDTGPGCTSTTVHKQNDDGDSKTVKKESCD
jgi:hypothetical protein